MYGTRDGGMTTTLPPSLLAQQQALLNALFDWPRPDATQFIAAYARQSCARGLKVYQANGHLLAERALQAAYPVVAQLLGGESFADLARAVWHAHPPLRGCYCRCASCHRAASYSVSVVLTAASCRPTTSTT